MKSPTQSRSLEQPITIAKIILPKILPTKIVPANPITDY